VSNKWKFLHGFMSSGLGLSGLCLGVWGLLLSLDRVLVTAKNEQGGDKMREIEETQKIAIISDKILEIAYNLDKFTTSDLQGAIEAQVMIAVDLGKGNSRLIKK